MANLSLYITSDKNTSGNIIINGVASPFNITAFQPQEFILDRASTYVSGAESANSNNLNKIVENKGIRVLVDDGKPNVVVYGHFYANARSAASIILPTSVLERRYQVISYTQSDVGSIQVGEYRKSQFSVVAVEDNTRIKVQLRKSGILSGSSYEVDLPKAGTIYSFQDDLDITGTSIESVSVNGSQCKKIAVFSGSTSTGIGTSNGVDPLFQQCYPINSWGLNYFITPLKSKTKFIIRILAKEDNTKVLVNGIATQLNAGEFEEFNYVNAEAFFVSADKGICVAQYTYAQNGVGEPNGNRGDPDMVILNPVEQNINDVTVFQTYKYAITQQYINVIIKDQGIASFKINGNAPNSNFIKIPNSSYSYLQESFSVAGSFLSLRLTSDSGFNAFCYGFGNVESYMYSAGTNVKDLYQQLFVNNEYAIEKNPITCKGSPFKATITLPYKPLSLNWKVQNYNDFVDNGPRPIDSTLINGKQIYKYILDTNIIYNTVGTFNFQVIANNPTIDGCSGEQEINFDLIVIAPPDGNFNFVTSNCIQDSISLSDNTPDAKFYDTVPNIKFKPDDEGIYNIRYVVANTIGCLSDTISKQIKIDSAINVNFSISKITCQNKDIEFSDLSKARGVSQMQNWYWDYGDGSKIDTLTSSAKMIHQYTNLQTYNPVLTVQTLNGCLNSFTLPVVNNPNPQINVQLPEVCLADAAAKFIDLTTIADNSNNKFSYLWNFNDSSIKQFPNPNLLIPNAITAQNPEVKYLSPGKYIVSLRVLQEDTKCVDTARFSFTVNGSFPKPLFYILKDTALCSNEFVEIRDSSWVDIGSIGKLNIYWGDGSDTTIEEPGLNKIYKHFYKNINAPNNLNLNYTIKINASSGGICQSEISNSLSIVPPPEFPIITTIKDYLCKSDTLLLNVLSKGGAPPFINSWTSENTNASIDNMKSIIKGIIPGQVEASLKVTDSKKCIYPYPSLAFFNTMLVRDIPTAEILPGDSIICNGDAINIAGAGMGYDNSAISTYSWYRNDTLISTLSTNSITNNIPGWYKLTVNDGKCNSVATAGKKVSPLNITKYSFTHVPNICIGVPLIVNTNAVDQYNVHYNWDFGDGFNYLKASPGSHKYMAKGDYKIKVNVTNDYCPKYNYQIIGSTVKVASAIKPTTFKYFFLAKQPFNVVTKTDPGYVQYKWNPDIFLDNPNKPNPIFNGDKSTDYTLTRTDTISSCSVTDEYEIIVSTEVYANVPNAFTPNNDGLNDVLKVEYSTGVGADFNFRIFNRWGKLMFQTNDKNKGWDGRDPSGILQEMDGYSYFLEYNYIDP
ncbi:MAG: PKD domain-containing protein, partial [Sediminibacterium sp.]|nr:PKD domain-containing protein [Sediminibacterium sp.]